MRIRLRDASEVAHVWASRSQAEGRCSNVFFDGPNIYSYGRHFLIARFDDKRRAVVMTDRRYSVTTAKHARLVRAAVSHMDVHHVPYPEDLEKSAGELLGRIERAYVAAVGARGIRPNGLRELESLIDGAARTCATFKDDISSKACRNIMTWKRRKDAGKLYPKKDLEAMTRRRVESCAQERARKKEQEERRAAEEARRNADQLKVLDAWTRGESDERPYENWKSRLPTRLRVKDGRVETSRGAQITVRRAAALWALLCAGRDVAGATLDNYTVNSWDGSALVVGCHSIAADELRRMAAVLKLAGELPAVVAAPEVK